MKGKVLGFDGNAGAITAEDGQRFVFTLADWKSDRAAMQNMAVDFVVDGSQAREIYATSSPIGANLGAMLSSGDLGDVASSPVAERARQALTGGLEAPIAIVVILACFMPAIATPMKSFSLFGLGDIASFVSAASGGSAGSSMFLMLRFIAPLAALWMLWCAFSGKPTRLATLVTAAGCVLAVGMVLAFRASLASAAGPFGETIAAAMPIGMGVWLLGLCAIGLVLTALGKLRNPLARA